MTENDELVPATVTWKSDAKDLAVLSVEENIGGQSVTFATRGSMDERDKVIVAGYPGAVQRSNHDFGRVGWLTAMGIQEPATTG